MVVGLMAKTAGRPLRLGSTRRRRRTPGSPPTNATAQAAPPRPVRDRHNACPPIEGSQDPGTARCALPQWAIGEDLVHIPLFGYVQTIAPLPNRMIDGLDDYPLNGGRLVAVGLVEQSTGRNSS
jgi:hypothetical protein